MHSLYRAFDIWSRDEGEAAVRYRCFEALATGKFHVQSKDFYRPPFEDAAAGQLDRQFLELFCETAPEVRSQGYDSVEEAIRRFDEGFD